VAETEDVICFCAVVETWIESVTMLDVGALDDGVCSCNCTDVVDVALTGDVLDVGCESADVIDLCAVGVVAMASMPGVVGMCVDSEVGSDVFCCTLDVAVGFDVRCCAMFEICVMGDVICDDDAVAAG